jgi:glycosyltransferase
MNLYIINAPDSVAVYGIGTYIRELTNMLRGSNIKVCVVYIQSDCAQIVKEETDDGIKHWYFPVPVEQRIERRQQSNQDLYYTNIVYLFQLHITERRNLIFHLNVTRCGKFAKELKNKFDCEIVLTIHYLNWCLQLSGNLTRFRQLLETRQTVQEDMETERIIETIQKEKETFNTVDHIICLSKKTLQILQNDYKIKSEKITVIYNGLTDNTSIIELSVLRQKHNLHDIPILLFAGRLENAKGLIYALRAFKTVLITHPHCRFIIAGNGEYDIFLKECDDVWMNVIWTGLINREKLYELYVLADIGVLPSFHEQCSYVAIEMMMHGLPMITTAVPGLSEMTDDGISSLQVSIIENPDKMEIDTELLAEKMLYLLKNPAEAKRFGENARKRYEECYSGDEFRNKMLAFYHSLYD